MRHVDYIAIPSNSSIELKPGSFHIMLIGLYENLSKNEEKEITLEFKKNGIIKKSLIVK